MTLLNESGSVVLYKKILLQVLIAFLFTSCTFEKDDKLEISTTTWVGYSPLLYAKEKGWLKSLNIKLLHVVSLSENMYLYEAGNTDAYVGTQYEYNILVKKDSSLVPVMLFDRSNGGDVVMSNVSIEELQNSTKSIDAYLEMDSINNVLLKDFIQKYKLQDKKINYINRDQASIATLNKKDISKATVIVTYIPYDTMLEKKGFKNIASTKESLSLLVIDALFTSERTLHKHEKQFVALKAQVDKAVMALQSDPHEFYETVKPYMMDVSYDEFIHFLNDIVWINKSVSLELKERMKESHFPTVGLL